MSIERPGSQDNGKREKGRKEKALVDRRQRKGVYAVCIPERKNARLRLERSTFLG